MTKNKEGTEGNDNILPGELSWWTRTWEETSQEISKTIGHKKQNLEIQYSETLIDTYKKFIHEFGYPEKVFYPCAWQDGSASKVFKEVIYLDNYKDSVLALEKEWYIVYEWNAETFQLEPKADLMIIMNPQVKSEVLTKNIKSKGYIMCNNYHLTADELWLNPEFTFIKNLETGKKEFHPIQDIETATQFSKHDTGYFVFQKK